LGVIPRKCTLVAVGTSCVVGTTCITIGVESRDANIGATARVHLYPNAVLALLPYSVFTAIIAIAVKYRSALAAAPPAPIVVIVWETRALNARPGNQTFIAVGALCVVGAWVEVAITTGVMPIHTSKSATTLRSYPTALLALLSYTVFTIKILMAVKKGVVPQT